MKRFLSYLIIIILISGVFYIINNKFNIKEKINNNNNNNNNNNINIINTAESNQDDIIYFAKGMSKKDYLSAVNINNQKINSNKKYQKILYNFNEHLDYNELENIYFNLNNSDIFNLEIIGLSVDKRNLYSIEIGKGKKVIMFEAGIHGAELANPLFITKFIIDLVNDYESKDRDIINLLNNYKITVLPVVNPDGYNTSIKGVNNIKNKDLFIYKNSNLIDFNYYKGNLNGIDLNRNMPSQNSGLHFKRYDLLNTVVLKPSINIMEYYAGEFMGSEPETKALIYWHNKYYQNIFAYITLHSSGRVIYSSKPNLSNELNNLSDKCAQIVNNITGYKILGSDSEEVGEGNDGTSTDFIAELLSGYNFSEITGRLSYDKYDEKISKLKYKACVINIETLDSYTQDLNIIKDEYYIYNLEKVFKNLIKQH
ncbi:MAG: M14 family metallopeptidase [Bacilli bacterium]|nr:M14 family metallopeptidase [Bacilli bacterium]MDD4406809.1 M14 family metallopeptidase [Bacilli bacterium]